MFKLLGFSVLAVVLAAAASTPRPCDANGDGAVDKSDIQIILQSIGVPTFPGDPRDVDANGVINIIDVRKCTLMCDKQNCAV